MVTNIEFLYRLFLTQKKNLLNKYEFVEASEMRTQITSDGASLLFVTQEERVLYPLFQFSSDGVVFPALQKVLPRLLRNGSAWDACFWLTTQRTVMTNKAVPTDKQIDILNSLEEIISLGQKAYQQSTYVTSTPLRLLQDGKNDIFQMFSEDLFNPDGRMIPEKEVIVIQT